MSGVLVTGPGGFLGTRLVQRLQDRGVTVHGFGSDHATVPSEALYASMIACEPSVVIHLATLFMPSHQVADIPPLVQANVVFGAIAAEAASQCGARFVNVSSAWQHYAGRAYDPVSFYAATKEAFRDVLIYYKACRSLVVDDVTLFDTYGPGDPRRKLVPLIVEAARTGSHLPMSSGNQLIDLVYVDDVVQALVRAAEEPVGDVVVRTWAPRTVREVVATANHVFGVPIDAGWGELPDRPREMRTDWRFGTPITDWSPSVTLEEGLARVWEA